MNLVKLNLNELEHVILNLTSIPHNFKVCAQRNVPAKRFKICHILYMSMLTRALIREKYKVARNEKRKKQLWVFVYLYKIWQILKHFAGTFRRAQTLKLRGVNMLGSFHH